MFTPLLIVHIASHDSERLIFPTIVVFTAGFNSVLTADTRLTIGGATVGAKVGIAVGATVGDIDGAPGTTVGPAVGGGEGAGLGLAVGALDGCLVGEPEG